MRNHLKTMAVFSSMAVLIIPFIYRAAHVEVVVRELTGRFWVGFYETIKNDGMVMSLLFFIIYMSLIARRGFLSWGLRFIAMSILGVVVLDILLFDQFGHKLTLSDFQKYYDYSLDYIMSFSFAYIFKMVMLLIGGGVSLYIGLLVMSKLKVDGVAHHGLFVSSFIIPLSLFFLPSSGYVHHRLFQNVINYNVAVMTEYRGYAESFKNAIENPFESICRNNGKGVVYDNIIVYMVESLSSYHSHYFGGLNNWTPRLDDLAEEYASYKLFFANGFTTEDGEIALLTGEHPIYPPNSFTGGGGTAFKGFWGNEHSLPYILKENGYVTYFLTTADLDFSSTGDWADSVGFDVVEGSESDFYSGWDRYHFDAAPDEALVERVLDFVDENEYSKYFAFVKTVSSHHPHIDPVSGSRSEELVIKYVDNQIDRLANMLIEKEYFDNGILIIVGDHRAMTPISRDEVEAFGKEEAYARVPLVVIGAGEGSHNKMFSQVDVYNGIKSMITGEECVYPLRGNIFEERSLWPKYILHREGGVRNRIAVFSESGVDHVVLNGADTGFVSSIIDSDDRSKITDYINYVRVRGDENDFTSVFD